MNAEVHLRVHDVAETVQRDMWRGMRDGALSDFSEWRSTEFPPLVSGPLIPKFED